MEYLIIGSLAGFAAGYLGIGGGLIIVPALMVVFSRDPLLMDQASQFAVATSLATMLATSLSSVVAHHRSGQLSWGIVWQLVPGLLVGAVLGAGFAERLSSDQLARVFGVFAVLAGLQLLLFRARPTERPLPGLTPMTGVGSIIGGISSLVGIGGGSMTAPWLMWHGFKPQAAIATAAACGYPIALAGSISFVLLGQGQPTSNLGYVHGPAALQIAIAGVICAPLGARAVHKSPPHRVRQAFGGFLLLVGAGLLWP